MPPRFLSSSKKFCHIPELSANKSQEGKEGNVERTGGNVMKGILSLVAASILTLCASHADAFLGKLIMGLSQGAGKAAIQAAPAGFKAIAPAATAAQRAVTNTLPAAAKPAATAVQSSGPNFSTYAAGALLHNNVQNNRDKEKRQEPR
jgi:hypothetical protein